MVNGSRRWSWSAWFLWLVPFLVCACSKKQVIREEPPRAAVAEALVFLSSVQGNPVCMVFDIDKRRSSSLFSAPKTKWRMNAWLLSPGLSTYLGVEKGKSKKGALAPVHSTDATLVFTTDRDEFLYYTPTEAGKILLLTDPLFADRLRSGQEEEIRYGRMPARLICGNRTIEGSLFYGRWAWVDLPEGGRKGPFFGVEPGGALFLLWGPGGEFLLLEKGGGDGKSGGVRFAVMQDRRGRWQETYQIGWVDPECAFAPAPCPGDEGEFRLRAPAWDVEGLLNKLDQVALPTEAAGNEAPDEEELPEGNATPDEEAAREEDADVEEISPPQETFWSFLRGIPQAKGESPVDFCLLKGSLWIEKNQRVVYGVGLRLKAQ